MENDSHITLAYGTIRSYVVGFVLSLALSVIPAALIFMHDASGHVFPSHQTLYAAAILCAVVQLAVQLVFFLHLGKKSGSIWNSILLGLAVFIVAVIVGGSLWIMTNLQHVNLGNVFTNGIITPQNETD